MPVFFCDLGRKRCTVTGNKGRVRTQTQESARKSADGEGHQKADCEVDSRAPGNVRHGGEVEAGPGGAPQRRRRHARRLPRSNQTAWCATQTWGSGFSKLLMCRSQKMWLGVQSRRLHDRNEVCTGVYTKVQETLEHLRLRLLHMQTWPVDCSVI